MKSVLFIGIGSIAKRHIKNIRFLLGDNVNISALRSGNGSALEKETAEIIDKICYGQNELESYYDIIFITNPTGCHYETLKEYKNMSDAFFIEKPVFVTGEEDIADFDEHKKIFYVACPLRYTKVMEYLERTMDFSKVHAIRCISSSYLPDWRQGADYRKCYCAHKSMGGGVSIDLIHEWDYICRLVGFPKKVVSIISKKSTLEIDSDDIAVYIAEYSDKVVELHLDYFGRAPQRKIEIFTEDDVVIGDFINQTITYKITGKEINFGEIRNDFYISEMEHFLDMVDGKRDSDHTLEQACKVLRIARGV